MSSWVRQQTSCRRQWTLCRRSALLERAAGHGYGCSCSAHPSSALAPCVAVDAVAQKHALLEREAGYQHRQAQPRPSSLRAGAVHRCGLRRLSGRRAIAPQHRHAQPRPPSAPCWRRAPLWMLLLRHKGCLSGRRAFVTGSHATAFPLQTSSCRQGTPSPLVLNPEQPGRTRSATPILPPRWRRATLGMLLRPHRAA